MFLNGNYDENDLKDFGFKSLGKNILISKSCTIVGQENIEIGDNVKIDSYCILIASKGNIEINSNIHIGAYSALFSSQTIVMEDFSAISQGVKIYTASDDYSGNSLTNPTILDKYKDIIEGDVILKKHTIVGANSIILPNVVLGIGVAVGALSLVTKNLKEWNIYSGVPARKIMFRSKELLSIEQLYKKENNAN